MRASSLVVPALILWPLGEIAAFAWVGGRIGAINTVALVLVAGFAGLALLRYEGFGLARQLQGELSAGRMPTGRLLEAMAVMLAAILLVIPGFISDVFAFLLLFAPIRRALLSLIAARVTVHTMSGRDRRESDGAPVIDLDADDFSRDAPDPSSPWADDGEPKSGIGAIDDKRDRQS